jgi:hypothetical protein
MIEVSGLSGIAAGLRNGSSFIASQLPQLLNDAARQAHEAMSPNWPVPAGISWATQGSPRVVFTMGAADQVPRLRRLNRFLNHPHARDKHSHGAGENRSRKATSRQRARAMAKVQGRGGGPPDWGGRKLVTIVTAGDDRVCPICEDLEGITYTVEEASSVIPAHPNCRCAFVPVEDKRYGPVIPDDPLDAVMAQLRRTVPELLRRAPVLRAR